MRRLREDARPGTGHRRLRDADEVVRHILEVAIRAKPRSLWRRPMQLFTPTVRPERMHKVGELPPVGYTSIWVEGDEDLEDDVDDLEGRHIALCIGRLWTGD